MDLIFLGFLWILYCTVHSLLIHPPVQNHITKAMGSMQKTYRLLYSGFAFVTIVPLFYYSSQLDYPTLFAWNNNWVYLRYIMWLLVAVFGAGGALAYNLWHFIGISQLFDKEHKSDSPGIGKQIARKGMLRVSRHPWYTATFLLLWSRDLNYPTIVENGILSLYLIVGTLLEERKL
ncbi:MAG: hypothetical protein MI922_07880, partial [Bacteroidales bacterium]|nr:hypothetical protein [Bacteroidales bacterium]